MSAAEVVTLLTLPLCGVIVQLQRMITMKRDIAETRADVRAIRDHLGIAAPASEAR